MKIQPGGLDINFIFWENFRFETTLGRLEMKSPQAKEYIEFRKTVLQAYEQHLYS